MTTQSRPNSQTYQCSHHRRQPRPLVLSRCTTCRWSTQTRQATNRFTQHCRPKPSMPRQQTAPAQSTTASTPTTSWAQTTALLGVQQEQTCLSRTCPQPARVGTLYRHNSSGQVCGTHRSSGLARHWLVLMRSSPTATSSRTPLGITFSLLNPKAVRQMPLKVSLTRLQLQRGGRSLPSQHPMLKLRS